MQRHEPHLEIQKLLTVREYKMDLVQNAAAPTGLKTAPVLSRTAGEESQGRLREFLILVLHACTQIRTTGANWQVLVSKPKRRGKKRQDDHRDDFGAGPCADMFASLACCARPH